MKMELLSIQIGQPKIYEDDQGSWETSFFKEPVSDPIFLGLPGLLGDAVANTKHHGGPAQAVLLYNAGHYAQWKSELEIDLPFGAFAENLTVSGMDESTVFVGDIYQIGEVRLQVTKPRIPCWKIARRWNLPDLTKRVAQSNRIGWYCRVLQEGHIEAGLPFLLLSRQDSAKTVAQAFQDNLSSSID